MNGRVYHLVPSIERPLNALADYAALLASSCPGESSLLTLPGANLPAKHLGVEVRALPDSHEIHLPPQSVLVFHYEGYGYSRKGYPRWLLTSLVQRTPSSLPIVAIIHEVSATGPWYTSAFWLSGLQRELTRSIGALSRAVVVTREQNLKLFSSENMRSAFDIRCAPVFSCIGEPTATLKRTRSPEIVVFGTPGRRRAVYKNAEALGRISNRLSIERIVDIGEPFPGLPKSVAGIPVTERGWCTHQEIQDILSTARFGAMDYPADILAKSSIFAAYSCFGLVPLVNSVRSYGEYDKLRPGRDYLLWDDTQGSEDMESIAASAHEWYQPHSLKRQAALLQHDVDLCFTATGSSR